MKKSHILILMLFLIGCSSSRQSVPLATERRAPLLSEDQAKSLARKLAREKGFDITHYGHGYSEGIHFVSGRWVWSGFTDTPHGHYDSATVELAADGSTNSVVLVSGEGGWLP